MSEDMSEDIKDIIEILELAKEDIENNNENITATLDLQDLKSLKNLLDLYQKEKEKNLLKEEYNEGYFQGRRDERNETDNKIKETIEGYTEKSKHPLVNAQSRREYTFAIRALQKLLEESH